MLVISGSVRPSGGFIISSSVDFFLARARTPNVSIIKFTHNNWAAVNGTSPAETACHKVDPRAATFTVSWTEWTSKCCCRHIFPTLKQWPQIQSCHPKWQYLNSPWPPQCLEFPLKVLHQLLSKAGAQKEGYCFWKINNISIKNIYLSIWRNIYLEYALV